MKDIAINVDHVSKIYKLYNKPSDRFKEALGIGKKVKRYTEHYALNDMNFHVNKGECVGIIGTNGAGKSTILKIITGVLNPTSGKVDIEGRISALLELGAGFNQEYSGLENVYLNGTMIGFSREEIDERIDDILEFADIGDFIHQPVKTYSSGMFVRLAFAVAINIDPEILIVDEALSVGDVFFQAKCYKKFDEFKEKGKTILFVSHDLGSIGKYCDRVVLLNKGSKVAEGTPKDMIDLYKKILVGQDTAEDYADSTEEPKLSEGEELEDESTEVSKDELPKDNQTKTEKTQSIQSNDETIMKSKISINPNVSSYGTDTAEIVDFAVMDANGNITNSIEKDSKFKIVMRVRFKDDIKDPIFAYTIKDLKGTDINGSNTMAERINVPAMKKGDEKLITFTQTMHLHSNEYLLSLGVTGFEENEFVVYHRLYDVCNILTISDKTPLGIVDLDSEISIE